MAYQSLLDEVEQLHGVSSRIEGLADQHPTTGNELMLIAAGVRDSATILAVFVATRMGTKPV